ncbi:MAG: FAD binding domain-containing protein [Propionibacteriales bacterium]|nr:FAD binding domain-containing protein [Propionibacteriales bacterium]
MKPAPFVYHRADTVDEAVDMLAATRGKVLAGGQSLIPLLSMRLACPSDLVDINRIDGLDTVETTPTEVRIGCLVRHRALELHDGAYAASPLLRRAVSQVAHATIRNRGTTVGSLVHADPAAEMPAVLALLDGTVEAVSRERGARSIAASDFFVGPLETSLHDDELAVSATFPSPAAGTGSSWMELARRHGDYAMVGVGAVVTLDEQRHIVAARVALISVGGVPVVVDVSGAAAGEAADTVDWRVAEEPVSAAIQPDADIHATAQYRAMLARVLTRRALADATADAVRRVAA